MFVPRDLSAGETDPDTPNINIRHRTFLSPLPSPPLSSLHLTMDHQPKTLQSFLKSWSWSHSIFFPFLACSQRATIQEYNNNQMKIVYNDIYNKGTLRLTLFLLKLATSTCGYWPRWFLDLTTDSECLLSLNSGSMLRLLSDLEQNRRTSELLKIWKIADITTFIVFLNAKKIRILASNVRFMESIGYSEFIIQFDVDYNFSSYTLTVLTC